MQMMQVDFFLVLAGIKQLCTIVKASRSPLQSGLAGAAAILGMLGEVKEEGLGEVKQRLLLRSFSWILLLLATAAVPL